MKELSFTWDPRKAATNITKHGISFDEATTVFYDPTALIISDPDHSKEEDRFVLLGASLKMNVLVVCHCYREDDSVIRIISARKATKLEKNQYRRPL
ncbi:MAG: BrnT family toxin [Elusimicrobia bacterium]|nr:BrnT family toxin [Elusimicrobiota bacterium]